MSAHPLPVSFPEPGPNYPDHPIAQDPPSASMSALNLDAHAQQGRREAGEDGGIEDDSDEMPSAVETQVAPQKKKKKKKSKNKAAKATGFEENYADAPVTPAEYVEEMEHIYNPARTFAERIEACIQRYRAKRKFDCHRKDLFDKFLSLGGIETGPKMFGGGLDPKAIDGMDAQEIATMTATDYVGKDKSSVGMPGQQNSEWVVDFEAVAKGYFSHKIPTCFDITNPNEVKLCTSMVRNFLNYILHHNVCPEYNDQVYAARTICNLAERELSAVIAVSRSLPGDFNMACSVLFGGRYKGLYSGDQEWAKGMDLSVGMSDEKARLVVRAGLAARGTQDQCEQAKGGELRVIKEENIGFEVTEILKPDEETRDFFKDTIGGSLRCLGTLRGRQWTNPTWLEEDETDDEGERAPKLPDEYEFWVEEDALAHFIVGMKVEAAAKHLNCGVSYFDAVFNVHCSFYTYLENERMSFYKEFEGIEGVEGGKNADAGSDEEGGAELEAGSEE
ncbi:MAG: hypothetical protein M1839_001960 [Geoglossum umbratile]|nr:MAG: hypothetical protein M1839_001960 [Geoglossum umbratile]